VIGPGWLPQLRPFAFVRRRTLAYTRNRRRRRKAAATPAFAGDTGDVIFDHGPSELPVATARSRAPRDVLRLVLGDFARWARARWGWFRPRVVPLAVAAASMLAIVTSAEYLARQATRPRPACPSCHAATWPTPDVPVGVTSYRLVR
jgi:hypothetical protein